MLVKVLLVPVNTDYVVLLTQDKRRAKFPRQYAKHVQAGDICTLAKLGRRWSLKTLTDDDELVNMKQLEHHPVVTTPAPIQTPEV